MASTERIAPHQPRTLRSKTSFFRPRLWSKSSSSSSNQHTEHIEHIQPPVAPRTFYVPTHAASSFASSTALKSNQLRPARPTSSEAGRRVSVGRLSTATSSSTRHASIDEGRRHGKRDSETVDVIEEDAEPSADFAVFLAAAEAAERSRFRTLCPPDPVPRQPPGLDLAIPPRPRSKPKAYSNDSSIPNRDSAYSSAGPSITSQGSTPSPPSSTMHPAGQHLPSSNGGKTTLRRQPSKAVQRITEYIRPAPLETHEEDGVGI